MPDIFEADIAPGRDRRMSDSEEPEHAREEVIEQTLSPKEDTPQNQPETPPFKNHIGPNAMHIFTSYCEHPEHVTFETQEENENILLLLRKSFITNIPWIFFSIILAFIPLFVIQIVPTQNTPFAFLSGGYVFALFMLYYLVVATYILISFITWYFNTSLITTNRIVDIDFSDLVYKNIAETKMDLIQDVSLTQAGALRTMFDFGDVLVQTAGSLDNFDLHAVPRPDRVVEIVESLIGKERRLGA